MKIKRSLGMIILLMFIVMCNSCICYATPPGVPANQSHQDDGGGGAADIPGDQSHQDDDGGGATDILGDANQMLPTLGEGYRPTVTSGTKAIDIISRILGVMNVLGIISIVVAITLIGFGTILGSANEKAVTQEKYVGILIAALLLTGGSALARMIMSVAEKIA